MYASLGAPDTIAGYRLPPVGRSLPLAIIRLVLALQLASVLETALLSVHLPALAPLPGLGAG